MKKRYSLVFYWAIGAIIASCTVQKKLEATAGQAFLQQPELAAAHTGVCIMNVSTGQYVFNYQSDKYFMPASNTKLFTCYAAMKYLGDSLEGLSVTEWPDSIEISATGDPTLLHPDFKQHPVIDFLKSTRKPVVILPAVFKSKPYGVGWAWDDYTDAYMAERDALPIYGNVVAIGGNKQHTTVTPDYFKEAVTGLFSNETGYINRVNRALHQNEFTYTASGKVKQEITIPFITSDSLSVQLLSDTIHKGIAWQPGANNANAVAGAKHYIIHSQPVDSMLRFMMHRSDNFYAEQALLMVSRLQLQEMTTDGMIARLLATDFKEMPQRPRWVDGSGLSRYNLFSPQDLVWLLAKMKADFSWQRITGILQTGNEGTLKGLYEKYAGRIYAKTGTLSNNLSLSGYLLTDKGQTLAFSIIINNHQASASVIRKQIEQFLIDILHHQ